MHKLIPVFSLLIVLSLTACKDSQPTQSIVPATSRAIYVCNVGAASISVIDLISGSVTNDIAIVGTYPNQLVYNNKILYCVNSGSNNITAYNTETGENEKPFELGLGRNPMNMVIFDSNLIYVSCLLTNNVLQIDRSSGAVIKTIGSGPGTTGITVANGKVFATNTNVIFGNTSVSYGPGSVTVIDGITGDSLATIPVSINPQAIGTSPDGNLHVMCTGNYSDTFGRVLVINPVDYSVTDTIYIGGSPGGMDVSSSAGIGYLSIWGLGVLSYDTEKYTVFHGAPDYLLGKGGSGLVSDEQGNVYISVWEDNQVIKIDQTGAILDTWPVGLQPQALAVRFE